jgi:LuxR family maltose regulon positive regulatory protein
LISRLDQVTQHVLTLVCAPAGYGKSTLLAEWIAKTFKDENISPDNSRHADQTNVCWLAWDPADNDPV